MWVADVHSDDIIPRGFDLSNPQETQQFIDDFRTQKAECWLKSIYKKLTGLDAPLQDDLIVVEGDIGGYAIYVWLNRGFSDDCHLCPSQMTVPL